MAPKFHIHDGDSWVDVTERVNLREPPTLSDRAEEGATSMSTLILDDRQMTLEVDPFTPFVAIEEDSESEDKVWAAGFLTGRTVGRTAAGYRDPIGRFWACELADMNERWHRRVFKAADADRGEETDNERVTWALQQMQDWGLLDDDTTYVSAGSASADLDAEDFRLRYPDDVMGSIAEAKSKNWWLQRQGDIGSLTDVAWWGRDNLNAYTSPLYLTNDIIEIGARVSAMADGSSEVWPLRMDHGLRCIPERMYSGAGARHRSGRIYRRNASTVAVIGVRDVVMNGTEQMTKARAITRAQRYLEDLGAEEFRVEGRVRLPAGKVTQLRAGMRVPVAMTHWPFGLNEWTWWRVATVGVTPAVRGPWYDVDIELVSNGEAASAPPEPPYEGDAIAALLGFASAYDEIGTFFEATGDDPPGGWQSRPTVGPLTPTDGEDAIITIDAAMTVRVSAEVWFSTVVSGEPAIAQMTIYHNDVQIGTDIANDPGGGAHGWSGRLLVDIHDVECAAGDQIRVQCNPAEFENVGGFGSNSGAPWTSYLIVGRGSHSVAPVHGGFFCGTWVGP